MAEERIRPDRIDEHNKIEYAEHVARYKFAKKFIKDGDTCLDIACGSGYGANIVLNAAKTKKVYGVDISDEAITYAREHFKDTRLEFIKEDASKIDFPEGSIDKIASFETIEHMDRQAGEIFLQKIYRSLKRGGRLLISCPNRDTYPAGYNKNPFHIHEYSFEEMRALISKYFSSFELYCQEMRYFDRSYKKPAQLLKHLPKSIVTFMANRMDRALLKKVELKKISPFFRILLYEKIFGYDVFPFVEDYRKCKPVFFIFVCSK